MFSFLSNKKPEASFDINKIKSNLRMGSGRMKQQQQKRLNNVKKQRKEMAELMNVGKLDAARIRVEAVIREDLSIEGLEVLNLFIELVASRIRVIAETPSCPLELKEAVTSILWAVPRIGEDIDELRVVRQQFAVKYGREFVDVAVQNGELSVNAKLMEKLSVMMPSNDQCKAYLESIAAEYNLQVDFSTLDSAEAIVAVTLDPKVLQSKGYGSEGGIRTATGLVVPPIIVPKDDLEARLLSLKRQ